MICIRRCAEPAILVRKKEKWINALLNAPTEKQRNKAESKYRHRSIKDALVRLFHGKCAYCESRINHIDYGHIEHFRPKSHAQFRCMTFDWNNLFLACAICNGPEYKSNHFPEEDEGGPPVNPCDDLLEQHLLFIFDPESKIATVVHRTERGRVSINLFGLNRPELRTHRSKLIEKLFVLSRFAATDQEARSLIEQSRNDDEEYAAFARALPRGF